MKALDLIKQAYRILGVLEAGGTPTDAEAKDALTALNQMIGSWNTEELIPYNKQKNTFDVDADTVSYTVGTDQTWDMDRPLKIESAYVTANGVDYPMEPITFKEYNEKTYKTNIATSIPTQYMYDPTYPYGTVTIWPNPTENLTMSLITLHKIPTFEALYTDVILPEGFESALKWNLAVELSAEFAVELSPLIASKAIESKAAIKTLNTQEYDTLRYDFAISGVRGSYDISSDLYL